MTDDGPAAPLVHLALAGSSSPGPRVIGAAGFEAEEVLAFCARMRSYYVRDCCAGTQALNAISPIPPDGAAAARQAGQLSMLQELAELGMALARAAAQLALADGNRPYTNETPPPEPCTSDSRPTADDRPRHDPGLTFARLSRAVRQTIALEARIAAGDLGPAPQRRPDRPPTDQSDPWLPVIRRALRAAADAETDSVARETLHRGISGRLDDLPDGDLCVDGIITSICNNLCLRPDLSDLPDDILALTRHGPPWSLTSPSDVPRATGASPRPNGPDPP